MPSVLIPGRASKGRRPSGTVTVDRASWQSRGLVRWYPFDAPYGTVIRDHASVYIPTSSLINFGYSLTSGWASSPMGGLGLVFDGSNDYINLSAADVDNFIQNTMVFTLAFWISLTNTTQRGSLIGSTGSSSEKGYAVIFENGAGVGTKAVRISVLKGSAGTPVYAARTPDNVITDTLPHHIALVGTGTAVEFYIDGISRSVTTETAFTGLSTGASTRATVLGGINAAAPPSLPVAATFLDCRLHNVRFSASEVWGLSDPATRWDLGLLPSRRVFFGHSGIAFDAAANSGYQAASSSYTFNRTVTGSDTFLAVDVAILSAGQTVTSIIDDSTGGAIPMIFLGARSTVTAFGRIESWGLVAPAAGTKTIAVTLSGISISVAAAVSYTGVHQTSPTEGYNSAQATNVGAADATVTVTPVADQTWLHAAVATDDGAITANQTSRNNVSGAGGSGANEDTGPISPAAATAMSYTDVGALATWAIGGYALRPITAANLFNAATFPWMPMVHVPRWPDRMIPSGRVA